MAKEETLSDDDPIELFKAQHESTIARILQRARDKEMREAGRHEREVVRSLGHLGRKGVLGRTLSRVLSNQGRAVRGLPSIRLKAPGGGKSFHFAHSSTTNSASGRAAAGTGTKGRRKSGGPLHTHGAGKATAHQIYVERDAAVDNSAGGAGFAERPAASQGIQDDGQPEITPTSTPAETDGHGQKAANETGTQDDGQGERPAGQEPVALHTMPRPRPASRNVDGTNLSNVGETANETAAFWDRYAVLASPADPSSATETLTYHLPLDSTDEEITTYAGRTADRLDKAGIPFSLTVEPPADGRRRHTVSVRRAKVALPSIANPTDGTSRWNITKLVQKHRAVQMAAMKAAVASTADGLSDGPGATPDAAQSYIDNPSKLSSLHGTAGSFGTIGATPDQRASFWRKLAAAEAVDGRVQNTLVVELPHEAGTAQHHEVIRAFTDTLTEKGIPFWAAIHKPGKGNDARNYHAHILFADRPAELMQDPTTGRVEWDFAITETITRPNRTVVERRPYRQNKLPEMRKKDFIPSMRATYSKIVNRVMAANGIDVRYDPRSYADMGLAEKPMQNVRRIVADKMKSRKFIVMDQDWTRRQINHELQRATQQRTAAYQRISKIEKEIRAASVQYDSVERRNAKAPSELRKTPKEIVQEKRARLLEIERLRIQRERAAATLVNESTVRALHYIVQATDRSTPAGRKGAVDDASIDPADLDRLHLAAREELKHTMSEIALSEEKRRGRNGITGQAADALMAWAREITATDTPDGPDNERRAPSRQGEQNELFGRKKPSPPTAEEIGQEANAYLDRTKSDTLTSAERATARAKTTRTDVAAKDVPASVSEGLDSARAAAARERQQDDNGPTRRNRYGSKTAQAESDDKHTDRKRRTKETERQTTGQAKDGHGTHASDTAGESTQAAPDARPSNRRAKRRRSEREFDF